MHRAVASATGLRLRRADGLPTAPGSGDRSGLRRAITITVLTGCLAAGRGLAANAAVTPAQEAAACSAIVYFHHVDTTNLYLNEPLWQGAWHHAWHEANAADRDLRAAIHHYLFTDQEFIDVLWLCGYGL